MTQIIRINDIIDVKITGIQPFGAFALLADGNSGLIHISEISDRFVSDISSFVKIGDTVKVKVLDFDEKTNFAKLSLKAVTNENRYRRVYYRNPRKRIVETAKGFSPLQNAMNTWLKNGITEELK